MADFHKKAKTDKPYNQGKIVSNSTGGGDDFSTRSSNPTVHNPVSKQTLIAPGGNAPMPPRGKKDEDTLIQSGTECEGRAETKAYWTIDQGRIMIALKDQLLSKDEENIIKKFQENHLKGVEEAKEVMPDISYMNAPNPFGGEDKHETAAINFARNPGLWGGGIGFLLKSISGQLEGKCGCWVSLGSFADLFSWWLGTGALRMVVKKFSKLGPLKKHVQAELRKLAGYLPEYKASISGTWASRWNSAATAAGVGKVTPGSKLFQLVSAADGTAKKDLSALRSILDRQLKNAKILHGANSSQYKNLSLLNQEYRAFVRKIVELQDKMNSDISIMMKYQTIQKPFYHEQLVPEAVEGLFKRYDQAWQSAVYSIFAQGANLLTLQVMRPKKCYGRNTFLNPDTCECECIEGATECGFMARTSKTISSSETGNITLGGIIDSTLEDTQKRTQFFLDFMSPGLLPQTDEIRNCEVACNCNLIRNSYGVFTSGQCKCMDCASGYTWKTGGVCHCAKDTFLIDVLGNGSWGKEHGTCVDNDVDSTETALGKTWDGKEICGYICAPGTHLGDGTYPDGCSRLEDNLSDSDVPTKEHYLYRTGCNYVCDERAISENCSNFPNGDASSFPPTCDAGYVWDSSALGCLCREIPPTCPSDDPACKRDDILNGEVVQDGEGGSATFIFRGCNGCTGTVPGPNGTTFPDPGSYDAMRALVAGWAGDVVEREGQENYRICVTRTGGPYYFWRWYAYDCEPEGCGPCS